MFKNDNTRVILDGKLVELLDKITITIDKNKTFPEATIKLTTGTEIKTQFLDVEIVRENQFKNDKETVTWSQFSCKSLP